MYCYKMERVSCPEYMYSFEYIFKKFSPVRNNIIEPVSLLKRNYNT